MVDLKKELGRLGGVKATHLTVVNVYNSRFQRIYSDRDPLSDTMGRVGHSECSASVGVVSCIHGNGSHSPSFFFHWNHNKAIVIAYSTGFT